MVGYIISNCVCLRYEMTHSLFYELIVYYASVRIRVAIVGTSMKFFFQWKVYLLYIPWDICIMNPRYEKLFSFYELICILAACFTVAKAF